MSHLSAEIAPSVLPEVIRNCYSSRTEKLQSSKFRTQVIISGLRINADISFRQSLTSLIAVVTSVKMPKKAKEKRTLVFNAWLQQLSSTYIMILTLGGR